jgi:hypothetical protein
VASARNISEFAIIDGTFSEFCAEDNIKTDLKEMGQEGVDLLTIGTSSGLF